MMVRRVAVLAVRLVFCFCLFQNAYVLGGLVIKTDPETKSVTGSAKGTINYEIQWQSPGSTFVIDSSSVDIAYDSGDRGDRVNAAGIGSLQGEEVSFFNPASYTADWTTKFIQQCPPDHGVYTVTLTVNGHIKGFEDLKDSATGVTTFTIWDPAVPPCPEPSSLVLVSVGSAPLLAFYSRRQRQRA